MCGYSSRTSGRLSFTSSSRCVLVYQNSLSCSECTSSFTFQGRNGARKVYELLLARWHMPRHAGQPRLRLFFQAPLRSQPFQLKVLRDMLRHHFHVYTVVLRLVLRLAGASFESVW